MNDVELRQLISDYVNGDISPEQHQVLEQHLKSDPQARATFREFMDLEASLRTWAEAETTPARMPATGMPRGSEDGSTIRLGRRLYLPLAVAVSIAVVAVSAWYWGQRTRPPQEIAGQPREIIVDPLFHLGTVLQQEDCVWSSSDSVTAGSRFSAGPLSLVSGVAQLRFDSGTDVVMQGPCELRVVSDDTAQLLAGNVFVNVAELSDGFTLRTPDATIIDEGTEYGVSLDEDATEVHVFDGSVFWEPVGALDDTEVDRIEAGEARRYLRSEPSIGAKIPLGMRKFVRRLEAAEREAAGEELLAYDGFENLAGRIRRGRSGFGWSGGWESGFRGRGKIAAVVEAPSDKPFGIDRTGRRQIRLSSGDAIRRDLEQALPLELGNVYYVCFLLQRTQGDGESERFFQLSLGSDERRGRRSGQDVAFGITSEGFPFSKSGGRITRSTPPIEDETVYFCVAKVFVSDRQTVETFLRVYQPSESVDHLEPTVWTSVGKASQSVFSLLRVRLTVGAEANYDVDELKIGTTWESVTAAAEMSK